MQYNVAEGSRADTTGNLPVSEEAVPVAEVVGCRQWGLWSCPGSGCCFSIPRCPVPSEAVNSPTFWPPRPSLGTGELAQAIPCNGGVAWASSVRGRWNHENSVPLPGRTCGSSHLVPPGPGAAQVLTLRKWAEQQGLGISSLREGLSTLEASRGRVHTQGLFLLVCRPITGFGQTGNLPVPCPCHPCVLSLPDYNE